MTGVFFALFSVSSLISQTVINDYGEATGITANTITVSNIGDLGALAVGDIIYVMQMQGASYDGTDGSLDAINGAGLFERAQVSNIAGNTITVTGGFANGGAYNVGSGVQVIRVPVYTNHTVPAGGYTAQPWDGSTGGVFAIEVTGTLTMSGDIDVTGDGFRGGDILPTTTSVPNASFFGTLCGHTGIFEFTDFPSDNTACEKGEGIAIAVANEDGGRARMVSGGGGGGYNSAGGGGGSSYAAGGDAGRSNTTSAECTTGFPWGFGWNGDETGTFGMGGDALSASGFTAGNTRVFLGGGGGAGNNGASSYFGTTASRGANGGGIVLVTADELAPQGNTIAADGNSSGYSVKGGGGGGGAGTIILNVSNYDIPSAPDALNTSVAGGDGGSAESGGASAPNDNEGEGGGGGGGFVWYKRTTTPAPGDVNVSTPGGLAGNERPSGYGNGFGGPGEPGGTGTDFEMPGFTTPLPVELVAFNASKTNTGIELHWSTNAEINTSHFEIQRLRSNASSKHYSDIGQTNALGSENSGASYTFIDNNLPDGRTLYYRLKIRDYDGQTSYSPVVQVTFDEIDEMQLTLAPNPVSANDNLTVSLQSSTDGTAQIEVIDLAGRRHYLTQTATVAGSQTLSVPTTGLSKGVYLLRITNRGTQTTSRFHVVPATR